MKYVFGFVCCYDHRIFVILCYHCSVLNVVPHLHIYVCVFNKANYLLTYLLSYLGSACDSQSQAVMGL